MTLAESTHSRVPQSPDPRELTAARAFAALASDLSAAADFDAIAGLVLRFAVTSVPCDWATIKLVPTRRFAPVSRTSDPRRTLTGIAGLRNGDQEGWAGSSVHAVKLVAGDTVLGAIAFYAAHGNEFGASDAATARLLADHAAIAIGAWRTAMTLSEAIDTRTVIAQAQGIVMERYRLDEPRAFEVLRRYSQDLNLKLHDVAQHLVTSRRLPDLPRPHRDRP